ncbi:hypothetical protein ACG2F4_13760 [Halalkalibaculum sp. DA3122]|uniref:hypothetical protein n=1 Tax=Halalkalibaculum sp. DA3122 TaxID=3373607 RepID=UPI003754A99D
MKKEVGLLILCMVTISSVVFYSCTEEGTSRNELADLAKAAFVSLDSKVDKGTAVTFQYDTEPSTEPLAPLFDNLGDHHYPVSTSNDLAQAYFDQGLKLAYAFNHAEAHRSFTEAARLDPGLAMAHWGQAYALGPNINDPFPDDQRKINAYHAIQQAIDLIDKVTEKEQALILALAERTSPELQFDLHTLNMAYMQAMREVAESYPEDPDLLTLFAESVMNTMPWNYWDNEGNPNPGTLEAKEALETAMKLNPRHPGAHHFYIHMVELPQPELAVSSAEVLGGLMPAAGHLVHMPSHIFIRVGRYEDAAKANIAAIAADEDYISQCYSQGMYPLGYFPHNIHFLWSAASFLGNSETAIEAALKTAEKVPVGMLNTLAFLQDYYSTPLLAYLRFGRWNDILTIPDPSPYKHNLVVWHYARGVAFVRKGNIKEAEEELRALNMLMEDPELESLVANYTNPTSSIVKVAQRVVAGEIEAATGNYDEAIRLLEEGVEFEDMLVYSEPAAWHIPVRQTLGAVLLKAGRAADAEQVYREDLDKLKNNGWSLMGLYQSLKAQNRDEEAQKVKQEFDRAWAQADIDIASSVL